MTNAVNVLDPVSGDEYNVISVTPDLALDVGYTYAGGLGVLEGDKFYAAASLGLRYLVISLLYSEGYVSYDFDSELNPIPKPQPQPQSFLNSLKVDDKFKVKLRNDDIEVEALSYNVGSAKAVFIRPIAPQWAVELTKRLYIESSTEERFFKYTLLAKSVAEYIRRNINIYDIMFVDLQEAYTALLPLILKIPGKYRLVIHTAGVWGHPTFPSRLINSEYGYRLLSPEVVLTEVGLAASNQSFAVSAKHLDVLLRIFPHFSDKLSYITNGVNLERWMHPELRGAYESHRLTLDTLPAIKSKIKGELEDLLRNYKDVSIDDKVVIMWGRRLTMYKRPDFILRFIKELRRDDIIYVLSGKAHPHDNYGLTIMKEFMKLHKEYDNVIYIPEYTVDIAKKLVAGADLLLFTPFSGWEACGTSYMKASINAVPAISSRDGGVLEFIVHNVNGWLFGQDIRDPIDPTSPEARAINEEEYCEFRDLTLKVVNYVKSNPDIYFRTALSALRSFIAKASMVRVLREYYPQLIRLPTI